MFRKKLFYLPFQQNVFVMKVVEENFRQLLQMTLCLWLKPIFVFIDEDFEINRIRPKFLSLLLIGKNSYRRDRKGSLKNIFVSGA